MSYYNKKLSKIFLGANNYCSLAKKNTLQFFQEKKPAYQIIEVAPFRGRDWSSTWRSPTALFGHRGFGEGVGV